MSGFDRTLLVVTTPAEQTGADPVGGWRPLVDRLAAALGLAVEVVEVAGGGEAAASADDVLSLASAATGPVLVLAGVSGTGPPSAPTGGAAHVLVPIDRSAGVRTTTGPVIRALEAAGAEIEQFHVIDATAPPVMWEGPGHHADAWFEQLRERNRADGGNISFTTGEPVVALSRRARGRDLVLMCWKGQVDEGRSRLVRAVLVDPHAPLLLVREAA